MLIIKLLLLLSLGFFIGGIPSGLLIGKFFGEKDLRNKGSHNIGATNAFRILGAAPAILILFSDLLKGLLPLIILKCFYAENIFLVCYGISAILGHDFSPYLKFKGGKGVATSLGVFLILSPKAVLITLLIWILILIISKIVSLASIAAGISLPVLTILIKYPGIIIFSGFFAGTLLLIRHHENIKRLLRGEEKRIRRATSP